MKRETILTAVVFLGVGFLAGYVYNAQRNSNPVESPTRAPAASEQLQEQAPADATSDPAVGRSSPGARSGALPPGHPPINTATTVKLLEDEAARAPSDPRPRLEIANLLYDHKQFEQAIPWYEKALELDPHNVDARTDLGTAYYNLGRADEAIREYRKSLEVDPNHQPTLYNMILVNLQGANNLPAAQAAWEQLHRLNPKYPGLDHLKRRLVEAAGGPRAEGRMP